MKLVNPYDTVILEVEQIEESPLGSVKDTNQKDSFLNPNGLSAISIADLLNLVKENPKNTFQRNDLMKDSRWKTMISVIIYPLFTIHYYLLLAKNRQEVLVKSEE